MSDACRHDDGLEPATGGARCKACGAFLPVTRDRRSLRQGQPPTPREFGADVGRAYAAELAEVEEAAFLRAITRLQVPEGMPRDDETLCEVLVGFVSSFTQAGMSAGARAGMLEYRPDLVATIERKLAELDS